MSTYRKVILTITKKYELTVPSDSDDEAIDKAQVVADRRLVKNKKKVEGEINMTELKDKEHWKWDIVK